MTIEYLRDFLVVAKFLNMTKAAEYLYIGQSSLSRHIAGLEASLGVSLLTRSTRNVALTEAGRYMAREGPRLLQEISNFEKEVQIAGSGQSGSIMVGSAHIYDDRLFESYQKFRERYRDIRMSFHHYDLNEICENVAMGILDLGISFSYDVLQNPFREHLKVIRLFSSRFCLIVRKDHALAKRNSVRLAELEDVQFVRLEKETKKQLDVIDAFQARFESISQKRRVVLCKSLESMTLEVKSGGGVALLPYPTALDIAPGLRLLEIAEQDSSFDVVLIARKENQNPVAQILIDEIVNEFTGA